MLKEKVQTTLKQENKKEKRKRLLMKNFLTEKCRKSCWSENDCRKVFPITNQIEKKKVSHPKKEIAEIKKHLSPLFSYGFFFYSKHRIVKIEIFAA